ncbi:Myb-like dna-binding protein, partial [Globisporangium splendens]
MVISDHIKSQYFLNDEQVIRLSPPVMAQPDTETRRMGTPWTAEEHNLFLEALEKHPSGPWKLIAAHIGTRTTRQTMTHAQRYREKIARRKRTLTQAGLAALHAAESSTPSANTKLSQPAAPAASNGSAVAEAAAAAAVEAADSDFDLIDSDTELSFADFNISLNDDVEGMDSERLLLSVLDSYEPLPFSEEEARTMLEHFTSDSSV